MPCIVGYAGDAEHLKHFGKKEERRGIHVYSLKENSKYLTVLCPFDWHNKPETLAQVFSTADIIVIAASGNMQEMANIVIAAHLSGKKGFILGDASMIEQITKGTIVEKYESVSDPLELRERLISMESSADSRTLALIDDVFKVKGIGVVALGFVISGSLKRHQALKVPQRGLSVEIKSLQLHDEDVAEIGAGNRFGACLKNVDETQVDKGDYFCDYEMAIGTRVANISTLHFLEKRLSQGSQYMAIQSMQDSPFILGQNLVSKPFASRGERALIVDKSREPFIIASAEVVK
jgi:selenocysteine-specific translation elongation factor